MSRDLQSPRVKPHALRSGDKVGIVAPASNIKRELLEAGCDALLALGYEPVYSESILDRDLYFAGSVERRARELEEMFIRDDVRAILCAVEAMARTICSKLSTSGRSPRTPKFSSDTATRLRLLTWFADSANLVTFHGPMVIKDFAIVDGVDAASWQSAVSGAGNWEIGSDSGARPLRAGTAEGILYGGCLSLLTAALGTPFDIQTANTILFLEDVAAKPFQIDRMLMQLKLAGKFEGVRGIVFGEMTDCSQSADQDYSLEEVVMRVIGDLGVPVAFGLRSGHVSRANITLPIGVRARLEVGTDVTLTILEAAVER